MDFALTKIKNYIYLYIIVISLLFTACGLPLYTVVDPPDFYSTGSTASIGFTAPNDDSNISGYEIYYKIYESGSYEIDYDEEEIDNSDDDYIYEFGTGKLDDLNFNRLMRLDSGANTDDAPSYPFINSGSDNSNNELNSGEMCIILVGIGSFDDDPNSYDSIKLNNIVNGIPLRIATDDDGFKDFYSDNVEDGDSDNNDEVDDTDSEYTIAFAAYSYVNNALATDIESSYPVYLGTLSVNNNN